MKDMKIIGISDYDVVEDEVEKIIRLNIETTNEELIDLAIKLDNNNGEYYKDGFMLETVFNVEKNELSNAIGIIYIGEDGYKVLDVAFREEDKDEVNKYIYDNIIDKGFYQGH